MQETLAEKTYQHVRQKLVRGQLSPGDRLVTRTLADEIGVSLAPVREAIRRLASESLVDHIPGAGAFVRDLDAQDLDELYVLRQAVEGCAAAEAAHRITRQQLEELEAVVADMCEISDEIRKQPGQQATSDLFDRWLDDEEHFHEVLVEASRNQLLAKIIREHRAISQVFDAQRGATGILTLEVAEVTCRTRKEFLQSLRNGDAERSRSLITDQIELGRKSVLAYWRERRRKNRGS